MAKNTAPLPISLCMIIKNEEAFLNISLKSVADLGIFDEIVVVDTGSTDNSVAIAKSYNAKVFEFEWVNDFAAARNFAAEKATNDWILQMDADEEIDYADARELKNFIVNPRHIGTILMLELLDRSHNHIVRLYNRQTHHHVGSIHEQIMPRDLKLKTLILQTSLKYNHHGYLPEYGKIAGRLERNENLLFAALEKDPKNPYLLYQLGKSYFCDSRDLQKACKYFGEALTQNPDPALEYVYNLVECYGYALINTNQAAAALKLREKYLSYYSNIIPFRFLSGHIFQSNAMFVEAVECYESCIGSNVEDFRGITTFLSHFNIGVLCEVVGMKKEAVRCYEKCGDYAPAKARLAEM